MEQALIHFENACIKSGESNDGAIVKKCHDFIESIQERSKPYEFCRRILQDPRRHPTAKFFASSIIEKAGIREWDILDEQLKTELCRFVISVVRNRSKNNASQNTIKKLIHCFAVFQKRGWTGKSSTTYVKIAKEVLQGFLGSQTIEEKGIGIKVIRELVEEFSISKTGINMSWKLHELARIIFQKTLLPFCMTTCLKFIESIVKTRTFKDNDETMKVLGHCVKILEEILSWDFTATYDKYELEFSETGPDRITVVSSEWKSVIFNPKLVNLVLVVHNEVRNFGYITKYLRNSFKMLCKAREENKPGDPPTNFRARVFPMLVKGTVHLCQGAIDLSKLNSNLAEEELSDSCECFFLLSLNYRHKWWYNLPQYAKMIQTLVKITLFLNSQQSKFTASMIDSFEMLLNGWAMMVEEWEPCNPNDTLIPIQSYRLFEALVQTRFQRKEDEMKDLFYDICEDKIDSVATLARVNVEKAVGLVQKRLSNLLQKIRRSGAAKDPMNEQFVPLWDELQWLLHIGTCVTCDCNEMPIAEIPMNVMNYLQSCQPNQVMNGITMFFKEIFGLINAYSQRKVKIPGRIVEKLLFFVSNWSYTFLMVDWEQFDKSHFVPLVESMYGGEQGYRYCELILHFIYSSLVQAKPPEGRPVSESSDEFLKMQDYGRKVGIFFYKLTNNEDVDDYFVEHSNSFKKIVAEDKETFYRLSHFDHGVLASLTRAICNCDLPQESWMQILVPLKDQFITVLKDPNFKSRYRQPTEVSKVLYCLHKFVSIGRSLSCDNIKILLSYFREHNFFPNFLKLLNLYQENEDIVSVILTFFTEFTTNLFFKEFLDANLFRGVVNVCLEIIKFIISMYQKSKQPLDKYQEGAMMDHTTQLICILINISLRRFLSFSPLSEREQRLELQETGENPIEVLRKKIQDRKPFIDVLEKLNLYNCVFKGIHSILSFIPMQKISQYREVTNKFYQLMLHIFGFVFLPKVSSLPPKIVTKFVSSIFFGLEDMAISINKYCLLIIRSIVFRGKLFFHPQKSGAGPALNHYWFLKELFKVLIFVKIKKDLIDLYAEILLPLIAMNLQNYKKLANDFQNHVKIGKEINVEQFFNNLLVGVSPKNSTEQNHRTFCKNLNMFLNIRLYVQKV